MTRRIYATVGFLVIPPLLGSLAYRLLYVGAPTDLTYWVSSVPACIGGWATFWAAIAEITGYSLRDYIAGQGRWRRRPTTVSTTPPRLATETHLGAPPDGNRISDLQMDCERAQQLLEATEKRLYELQMKRQEFGPTALTAGELAELRNKEKERNHLIEKVLHLKEQIKD